MLADKHSRLGKRCLIVLAVIVTVLLSGPWVIYELALLQIEGRPKPPKHKVISAEKAHRLWFCLGQKQSIFVQRRSPPYLIYGLLVGGLPATRTSGDFVVWQIAKNHNIKRSNSRRHGDRHLAGAGLTIWLTRNWTSDQILTAAHDIVMSYPKRYRCTRKKIGPRE